MDSSEFCDMFKGQKIYIPIENDTDFKIEKKQDELRERYKKHVSKSIIVTRLIDKYMEGFDPFEDRKLEEKEIQTKLR